MVFVDTSAFFAWYVQRDSRHRIAHGFWQEMERRSTPLVTTNHVAEETLTLLARKVSYSFAAVIAERFYEPNPVEIIFANQEDEYEAVRYFRKFADQKISFTDCISFAIMKRNHIFTAFTFDRHFVDAGFELIGLE
jgi:uncharacterized protein